MKVICFVCLDSLVGKETWSLICGHIFCHACIEGIRRTSNNCPVCRAECIVNSKVFIPFREEGEDDPLNVRLGEEKEELQRMLEVESDQRSNLKEALQFEGLRRATLQIRIENMESEKKELRKKLRMLEREKAKAEKERKEEVYRRFQTGLEKDEMEQQLKEEKHKKKLLEQEFAYYKLKSDCKDM